MNNKNSTLFLLRHHFNSALLLNKNRVHGVKSHLRSLATRVSNVMQITRAFVFPLYSGRSRAQKRAAWASKVMMAQAQIRPANPTWSSLTKTNRSWRTPPPSSSTMSSGSPPSTRTTRTTSSVSSSTLSQTSFSPVVELSETEEFTDEEAEGEDSAAPGDGVSTTGDQQQLNGDSRRRRCTSPRSMDSSTATQQYESRRGGGGSAGTQRLSTRRSWMESTTCSSSIITGTLLLLRLHRLCAHGC